MQSARRHLRLVQVDEEGAPAAAAVPTLEEAFRAFAPYVAAIGLRLLGRPADVDDLVQDVFIEARRGLSSVRDPAGLKGWLARIAVRTAMRRLKRRRRFRLLGLDRDFDYTSLPAHGASPEQAALLAAVYRALDRLPPSHRIAWTLRYVQGERLDRVARLCDCSLATAKRRIAAAHDAIREAVDDG